MTVFFEVTQEGLSDICAFHENSVAMSKVAVGWQRCPQGMPAASERINIHGPGLVKGKHYSVVVKRLKWGTLTHCWHAPENRSDGAVANHFLQAPLASRRRPFSADTTYQGARLATDIHLSAHQLRCISTAAGINESTVVLPDTFGITQRQCGDHLYSVVHPSLDLGTDGTGET